MQSLDLQDLRRVQAGEQHALRALYDRHHGGLYRFLRSDLGREDAEEVLQDVFMTVWHRAGTFREASTVSTWLYGIARNLARNRQRKHRPTHELLEGDAAYTPEQVEFLTALAAVRRLPAREREVVELVSLGELSLAEAASVLGIPVGTVKSRLHAARQRLRAALGGERHGP